MAKKKGILDRLKDGPVLGDGGYLLELEKRGWVRAGPFTPEVALLHPDALRELHVEFREAGADVLQALTFYASRDKLATVGLDNKLEDLNRAAVRIAREVAGDQCLVAGNLSLTWMYEPGSPAAADSVRKTFDEQLAVQVDEGVDFIIGETFSLLGEALIAVERARKTGLPVMVTICFENKDETADGKSAAESAKALLDAGADIVGMNCLRPPEHTLGAMEADAQSGVRLSCLSAGGVSHAQGQAGLHQLAGISSGARSAAAHPKGDGRLRSSRPRNWDQLHRFLLRIGRHPRSGDGACAGQAVRKTDGSGRRAGKSRCQPTSTTGTTKLPPTNADAPQLVPKTRKGPAARLAELFLRRDTRRTATDYKSRSRDQPS